VRAETERRRGTGAGAGVEMDSATTDCPTKLERKDNYKNRTRDSRAVVRSVVDTRRVIQVTTHKQVSIVGCRAGARRASSFYPSNLVSNSFPVPNPWPVRRGPGSFCFAPARRQDRAWLRPTAQTTFRPLGLTLYSHSLAQSRTWHDSSSGSAAGCCTGREVDSHPSVLPASVVGC
jgi:hypothetical protein